MKAEMIFDAGQEPFKAVWGNTTFNYGKISDYLTSRQRQQLSLLSPWVHPVIEHFTIIDDRINPTIEETHYPFSTTRIHVDHENLSNSVNRTINRAVNTYPAFSFKWLIFIGCYHEDHRRNFNWLLDEGRYLTIITPSACLIYEPPQRAEIMTLEDFLAQCGLLEQPDLTSLS